MGRLLPPPLTFLSPPSLFPLVPLGSIPHAPLPGAPAGPALAPAQTSASRDLVTLGRFLSALLCPSRQDGDRTPQPVHLARAVSVGIAALQPTRRLPAPGLPQEHYRPWMDGNSPFRGPPLSCLISGPLSSLWSYRASLPCSWLPWGFSGDPPPRTPACSPRCWGPSARRVPALQPGPLPAAHMAPHLSWV